MACVRSVACLLRGLGNGKQPIQSRLARSQLQARANAGQPRHVLLGKPAALQARGLHAAAALCKELDVNPFYEKYKDKLDKFQGQVGKVERIRSKLKSQKPAKPQRSDSHPATYYTYQAPPSLESVMHVGMIADKTPEEISEIWKEYYKTKDFISAVIPAETYIELHSKGMLCPFFVYPLPRDEGYEFFYSQFSGHRCYFTSLINYQLYQENAPPCLTLSHYTEFQESKGIVLMAGEVDTTVLSTLEAQFLANQLQLYYASNNVDRYAQVRTFNHDPDDFDHRALIDQLENSGIQLPRTVRPGK